MKTFLAIAVLLASAFAQRTPSLLPARFLNVVAYHGVPNVDHMIPDAITSVTDSKGHVTTIEGMSASIPLPDADETYTVTVKAPARNYEEQFPDTIKNKPALNYAAAATTFTVTAKRSVLSYTVKVVFASDGKHGTREMTTDSAGRLAIAKVDF